MDWRAERRVPAPVRVGRDLKDATADGRRENDAARSERRGRRRGSSSKGFGRSNSNNNNAGGRSSEMPRESSNIPR